MGMLLLEVIIFLLQGIVHLLVVRLLQTLQNLKLVDLVLKLLLDMSFLN